MKLGTVSQAIEKTVIANGNITAGDRLLLDEVTGVLKAKKFALEENIYNPTGASVNDFNPANATVMRYDFDIDDSGNIVILYRDSLNSNYISFIVGAIQADGTITFGTKGVVESVATTNFYHYIKYSKKTNKFLLFYGSNTSGAQKLITGTISGTSLSLSVASSFTLSSQVINDVIFNAEKDVLTVSYHGTATNFEQFLTSFYYNGTQYIVSNVFTLFATGANKQWAGSYFTMFKGSIYLINSYGNSDTVKDFFHVFKISYNATTNYTTAFLTNENVEKIINNGRASGVGSIGLTAFRNRQIHYKNKLIEAHISNAGYIYVRIYNDIKRISAIATETVLDSASVKVKIIFPFISFNFFTGLISGAKYFLNQNDYTLQTLDNDTPVGIALSTTELLITSDNFLLN